MVLHLWSSYMIKIVFGAVPSSVDSLLGNSCVLFNVCQSRSFDVVCDNLLGVDITCLSVYIDGSLSDLGTHDMKAGAAVFFEDINSGLGISVFGLVSSTMVELQAISLALECVLSSCSVNLFSNSQAALDACKSESLLKNLDVNWIKVKSHLGILDNVWADALVMDAASSSWQLSHIVGKCFLKAGSTAISGNLRHFVCGVFQSVHQACWEVGFGSKVVMDSLWDEIDWSKFSLVWHPDSHMAAGFTSTYFMKALHYRLPVAVHKHLYDKYYSSVVCLFCGDIEVLDHAGLTSFFAAGAFVDDTIWIGSSQTTIQHIFDVASEFFKFNDIFINNDKTVAIPINCRVESPYLTISGLPISITKKGESYHYLGIFLSFKGLSKPSLAKAYLNIWFFVNLVMRKAISDKQFAYLVSVVLFPIVGYRTQFNALIQKGLKSKSGLPHDFPSDAIYHLSLYGLKFFEQIQAKSKSASVLFSYRSYDLQVLSWCSHHSLVFLTHIGIIPLNSFLADVVCIFSGCDLSLGISLSCVFHLWEGTPMFLVLGKPNFLKCVSLLKHYGIAFVEQLHDQNSVKRLDPCGPISLWFDLSVHFLSGAVPSSVDSLLGNSCVLFNVCQSRSFDVVCDNLLGVDITCLSVYIDGSLSDLGTHDMKAGAAVFFEDINSGLGISVFGLVSSTMVELQAISLALECVLSSCSVNLFSNSQAALDACKSESLLKNLDVNWIKVKSHLGILDNVWADALVMDAASSSWQLSHIVGKCFLKAGSTAISGNLRHFVCGVFQSVHQACWEVGFGSKVVMDSLWDEIDWSKFSLVWHPDSHMAAGFTSTYFMKALHYRLPVAVHKHLYDKYYSSVVCLFCGDIEVLDHVVCSGLSHFSSCVSQLLSTCISDVAIGVALYKGFVFNDLYCESVSVYKDPKVMVFNVVDFVHKFCLAFRDDIWLVHTRHWAIIEKNKLIPHDGSVPVSVSSFASRLLAGMVRLLGIADALGISFGFCKSCLFFAGISNMISVGISA
ncbi:hypothetical protein G9A89_011948 [Geosiphon pyriformis]|nr:hypothetical protein G9A89_011948 [Geosiphon pyriformis]